MNQSLIESFYPFSVPTEEPMPIEWCLDTQVDGQMYWRRNSQQQAPAKQVKFRCEVEVLEFVRDPEEELFMAKNEFKHSFSDQHASHPIVVISTCICAIAVTVLLPWLMVGSNEPID